MRSDLRSFGAFHKEPHTSSEHRERPHTSLLNMTPVDFFTQETQTSSFIQDVLSSVNYDVSVHSTPSKIFSIRTQRSLASIILWDLDSFPEENEKSLSFIRANFPDSMIFAYAEDLTIYGPSLNGLADVSMNVASLRVHLMSKLSDLKRVISARETFRDRMSHLVGSSLPMENLRKSILKAMIHTSPVLIQGETGVGKELIARAVACMYDKFVTVNCSAIPDNLFESELFGHVRGAFTGAQTDRIGLFEEADGGAIFLDEIGDMPLHTQVKLLRVLQNREIRPVGANKTRHINVRIIAATNRNLKQAVAEKKFREDLYYRLNVIPLSISPLRNRPEDVADLARYFISQYQNPGDNRTISEQAIQKLQEHSWPGNIRELENLIQRTLCFANAPVIQPEDLSFDTEITSNSLLNTDSTASLSPIQASMTYDDFRESQLDQEREFLKKRIALNGGSVSTTAKQLGLIRTALYNRLRRLDIDVKEIS